MEGRIDIIVLGATGFTGKHAVKNLVILCKETLYSDITWGIAGRSKMKINDLVTELEELNTDVSKIPVFECDILKSKSLPDVTRQTKILVNATGPNTVLSAHIVEACIRTRTHYVDISAELYHMLNIYRAYNKSAEEANVLIVPACGFDCIPALGGLLYLERNFEGTLHTVECYNVLDIPKNAYFPGGCKKCILNYGTWESMIHEMKNFKQYRELKKEIYGDPEPVPAELKKRFFHRHEGRFWCPYPGPDHDVAEMYQHYQKDNGHKPYYFKSYITMPLFIHFFIIVPVFFMYYMMSHFACLRNLLWKYPKLFTLGYVSHEGPNEEMRKELKYSFTMIGKGWSKDSDMKSAPDRIVTVKVSGNDPGYTTTSMALILSAITVLKERVQMPLGGVLTSGAAFRKTDIIEKLQANCMNFEVLKRKSTSPIINT